MNSASLYIHIPFCQKKCAYCAFFSLARSPQSLIDDYFAALEKQLSLLEPLDVSTVYLGGGTPTVGGAKNCVHLLEVIQNRHHIANDAEITIEANPGTVDAEGLRLLYGGGFNRLSLGLQSGDDFTLRALGRCHTVSDFMTCYDNAASVGFCNISVDIMFGLPKEYGDGLARTLDVLSDIEPPHVSAYSLSVEKNTPLFKSRDELTFPDEDEEEQQYDAICGALSGYEHYEVSSFAKPGRRSRHNMAYWTLKPYIGIGAAAHSFYNGKRFCYPPDVTAFIKSADKPFGNSDYPTAVPESADELDEERVMLGLRTFDGALLSEAQKRKAAVAVRAGLASLCGDRLILNEKGYRVSNEIIAEILA